MGVEAEGGRGAFSAYGGGGVVVVIGGAGTNTDIRETCVYYGGGWVSVSFYNPGELDRMFI